jgi:transcriptional regulator with GAF, ATPase, and Fis domain
VTRACVADASVAGSADFPCGSILKRHLLHSRGCQNWRCSFSASAVTNRPRMFGSASVDGVRTRRRSLTVENSSCPAIVVHSCSGRSSVERVERRHLSLHPKLASVPATANLATIERQTIESTLRQTDWNKAKTARRLGLTRTQLYVRLRRYGIVEQANS